MKGRIKNLLAGFMGMVFLAILGQFWYARFDLTEDQRFTLGEAARSTVDGLNSPVIVDVLLAGDLPAEFERLQAETLLLLDQYKAENPNIIYNLVDPLENANERQQTLQDLQSLGLKPANVTISENGTTVQKQVVPWAMVNHQDKTVPVQLLRNTLGANTVDRINNSVRNLEYGFADAFIKLKIREKKKIAVLKGNGETGDQYLADFLSTLREYYNIGAITLDSVESDPIKVLQHLNGFDLVLVSQPKEAFTRDEKYVLDQFMVNGGRSLWLMDRVAMSLDTLLRNEGQAFAKDFKLDLEDLFFTQGLRLDNQLVNDLYNTPIVLASGEANDSQYQPLPFVYHPRLISHNDHPININTESIRAQFANSIDTLPNQLRKTVLLKSSPLSKKDPLANRINMETVISENDPSQYQQHSGYFMAVLVEGDFQSTYKNRVKPFKWNSHKDSGPKNAMILIADGDMAKNQFNQGRPLELGFDKWTNGFYGNKEFLVNCVNYLLDESGLLAARGKNVDIPLLDPQKIVDQKTKWQLMNIGLPALLIALMAAVYTLVRKRRYA